MRICVPERQTALEALIMENPMNQRLPANPNLRIYTTPEYRGMPIQANTSQPCLEEYLNKAYRTLERTKKEYKRIFAARIDLRYPAEGARGRQNATVHFEAGARAGFLERHRGKRTPPIRTAPSYRRPAP